MATNLAPQDANPLADRLAEDYAAMVDRTDELVDALARAPAVVTEENFDRSGAFVRQLREHSKLLEATRENEKKEFLAAGRTVDGFFKQLVEQLAKAATTMEGRIRIYLQAKEHAERALREAEAKRQREEQERLAAEAQRLLIAAMAVEKARTPDAEEQDLQVAIDAEEARKRQQEDVREAELAALASAADLARTRSAIAGTATLASHLDFEITDHRQAVCAVADLVDTEALARAIRAYSRTYKGGDTKDRLVKTQPLPGVTFYLKQTARVV